ncbi:MAG TPA: hypothetical protein VE422_43195 [Terriglobia bacterium]|nr:hypothetical protein [Terriglobia bacterium]
MKSATIRMSTAGDPADRILAIVSKIQQEALDREAAVRMHDDATGELQLKLEEARATISQLLEQASATASEWREERARFEEQIAALNSETQKIQQEALDREAAARLQTREDVTAELQLKLEEARASIAQLHEQASAGTDKWQQERARFEEQVAGLNSQTQKIQQEALDREAAARLKTREDVTAELQPKLEEARASIAQLEEQIAALNSQTQKIQQEALDREAAVRMQTREDVAAELQLKLDEAQASIAQLEEQIAALNSQTRPASNDQPNRGSSAESVAVVEAEIARVQSLMDEIDTKLADASLELSAEMRLRRERVELEVYLKGLRFSQSKP